MSSAYVLTPTKPLKLTKRDVIKFLYKDFYVELYEHIDLTHLFPSYDDLDVADLVFQITFLFPSGCNIDNVIRELIVIKDIKTSEETIIIVIPIIVKFLLQFHSI
jgi:hypothetical protein